MSIRWVLTVKDDGTRKARLVARRFQEDTSRLSVDSPTCSRKLRRFFLTLIAHFNWTLCSPDVKTEFLQGEKIGRDVFLKRLTEADTLKIWKLNKCVYGLGDAVRMWYVKILASLLIIKRDKAN